MSCRSSIRYVGTIDIGSFSARNSISGGVKPILRDFGRAMADVWSEWRGIEPLTLCGLDSRRDLFKKRTINYYDKTAIEPRKKSYI